MRATNLYTGPAAYPRPVATNEQLDRIIDSVKANGGHSEHLPSGDRPTDGYMVSIVGSEQQLPLAVFGYVALHRYVKVHATKLRQRNLYLGIWVDGFGESNARKTVYLDISERVDTHDEAVRLGRERKQLAIYDVALGDSVGV